MHAYQLQSTWYDGVDVDADADADAEGRSVQNFGIQVFSCACDLHVILHGVLSPLGLVFLSRVFLYLSITHTYTTSSTYDSTPFMY